MNISGKLKQCIKRIQIIEDLNYPVYLSIRKNIFLRIFSIIFQIITTLFYFLFEKRLKHFINERIVEIPFIFSNLKYLKGNNILDFGNNDSLISLNLASIGYKVTGVDLLNYNFFHENLYFQKGNFLKLNLPTNSFDGIIAISAIEHVGLEAYHSEIFEDGDFKVIEKFFELLKRDGILFITVPFGVKHKDSFLRIYNSERIALLLKNFTIIEKRYFVRNNSMDQWKETIEEKANNIKYNRLRGVDCVVCIICKK